MVKAFSYDFSHELIHCISQVFITGNYVAGPGPYAGQGGNRGVIAPCRISTIRFFLVHYFTRLSEVNGTSQRRIQKICTGVANQIWGTFMRRAAAERGKERVYSLFYWGLGVSPKKILIKTK